MSIAASVERHLNQLGVKYDVIPHQHTSNTNYTAQAAHVPGEQVAKCVMLEDDQGYVMAVLPATRKVDLGALHRRLGRDLGLATESELARMFSDCELGAIPPLGDAYGIDAIVDKSLLANQDVYFESGDHCALVHVSGADFLRLMGDAPRDAICYDVTSESQRTKRVAVLLRGEPPSPANAGEGLGRDFQHQRSRPLFRTTVWRLAPHRPARHLRQQHHKSCRRNRYPTR